MSMSARDCSVTVVIYNSPSSKHLRYEVTASNLTSHGIMAAESDSSIILSLILSPLFIDPPILPCM